jgi:hypothetical protein
MKNVLPAALLIAVLLALAACTGIPLRSMPRLLNLQSALLKSDPADLMLAVQTDARMVPPAAATPQLIVKITPADPAAFKPVDKTLPMKMVSPSAAPLGLPAAGRGRRWLLYSLPPESQRELAGLRDMVRQMRADNTQAKRATLSVGIAQEGIAARDPSFADTEWDSWLQVSRDEGFFQLWSGTVADLLKAGRR